MTIQYPLREKRKKQSRNALLDAASDLFANKGYEETTLDSVAQRAGLHVQTLYKHFPTKAELAAALWHDSLLKFEEFFAARECDALSAWRDWVELNALELTRKGNASYKRKIASFASYPTVSTSTLEYWYRYEEVLAQGLAEDMGVDIKSDPLPMLIACMLWGGNQHTAREWFNDGGKANLAAALLRVVDTVRDQFQQQLKRRSRR